MTVHANIHEVLHDGGISSRGDHEFVQLPSAGDRIVLPNARGALDIMRVLYVEHSPVATIRPRMARSDPRATVVVEWIEDYDGDDC